MATAVSQPPPDPNQGSPGLTDPNTFDNMMDDAEDQMREIKQLTAEQ